MRRFQYFIDFDGTVRIDNKDDDYPAGNTPWPKLFGIFNSFCNIFFKHSQIIRLALFKTSRGSYFRDIGKIVFHRLSVRNFFAPFRRGLKRIDSGQRRAKQLQCPFFHDNRLAATGVGNFQISKAWVLNENKSQTSANKYTNLHCIIWGLIFSVVFILFS